MVANWDLRTSDIFGCAAYKFIPKEDKTSKLDPRNAKLIMTGYVDNGYRFVIMLFMQEILFLMRQKQESLTEVIMDENTKSEGSEAEANKEEIKPAENRKEVDKKRRKRELNNPLSIWLIIRFQETIAMMNYLNLIAALSADHLVSDVPQSYRETIQNKGFTKAIEEEENGTWELIHTPVKEKIIDSKWVLLIWQSVT